MVEVCVCFIRSLNSSRILQIMKTLIFAVAVYNLAETGRIHEIDESKAIGKMGRRKKRRPISF